MRLPISLLLQDSWDDFKIFIRNPYMVLLSFLMALFAMLPGIDIPPIPDGALVIPAILAIPIIFILQTRLIYNIKSGSSPNKDILTGILSLFLRYLWYSLPLLLAIMLTILPPVVIYFVFFQSMLFTALALLFITLPAVLYIVARLCFYPYFLVIDNEKKPIAASLNTTKKYQWSLMLFYVILFVGEMLLLLPFEWGISLFTDSETITNIFLIPFTTVIYVYMMPAIYNAWWFCRNQYRVQQMREGTPVSQ